MSNRKKSAGTKAGKSTKVDVKKSSQTIAKPHVGRSLFGSLIIDANETGFTIWVRERVKLGGKRRIIKHWIVDASALRKDGLIRMGTKNIYKIEARYNDTENRLEVGVA